MTWHGVARYGVQTWMDVCMHAWMCVQVCMLPHADLCCPSVSAYLESKLPYIYIYVSVCVRQCVHERMTCVSSRTHPQV